MQLGALPNGRASAPEISIHFYSNYPRPMNNDEAANPFGSYFHLPLIGDFC
jgi:hypothetical protein